MHIHDYWMTLYDVTKSLLQTWPASPASENVVTKSQLRTLRTLQTSVIDRRLTLPNGDRRSVPASIFGTLDRGNPGPHKRLLCTSQTGVAETRRQ
jgi:hypothetical protein